jgi:Flp pilus assembly protein CpaB
MKSRLLRIALAVIIAILAASLAYQLSGSSSKATAVKSTEVYVATALIERGTTLNEALQLKLVKVEIYPDSSLPSDVLGPETSQTATNPSSTDLSPGTILSVSQFNADAALTSITGLEMGMVAVTGNFKLEESVARLVQKGDSVAVYATFEESDASTLRPKTKMIISSARVVLMGLSGATEVDATGSQLVTLSLTPEDAGVFIHAAKTASMQLVLLRPGDTPNAPKPVSSF